MKNLVRSLLPKKVCGFLRERRRHYIEKRYFQQGLTKIKCGAFELEAPKHHLLVELLKIQPYRDLCVGIVAKHVAAKYPEGTIIDIGANIGDTAAIIATYARNKLLLVEASGYFFEILLRNAALFPNDTLVKKALIADGSDVSGSFHHWGGTASFREEPDGKINVKTQRLSEIAHQKTCFVKTDTDGYDFKILANSIEWLAAERPAVLFENEIRNIKDLIDANELYACLMQVGYRYFIVWDDPGFHVVSTSSLDIVTDLNRYLFKLWQHDGPKGICNYDVLALHENDKDVYDAICQWCRNY